MRHSFIVLCVGAWSSLCNALTLNVETYGDSLTAGFLSKTQVTAPPPLSEVSEIITDMTTAFRLKDRSVLARHHYPDLAWPKLVADLLSSRGKTVDLRNYAVSGNRSYDLLAQVKRNTQIGETAAFFFIGHNDLCDAYPTSDEMASNYRLGMKDALKEWARRHKKAEAFIIPVGKVDEVFALLEGYKWKRSKDHDFTCNENWDRNFPYCRAHYKRLKAGTLDAYLKERIQKMNTVLLELTSEMMKEDSKNQYTFLGDTHAVSYDRKHFAVDCYHLSHEGQQSLADRILSEAEKMSKVGLF